MQSILKIVLITVISLSGFGLFADQQKSPNVLIIMADDCTYNDLSLYGGVNAKTPHIERLASGGLVFEQAYLCGDVPAMSVRIVYGEISSCQWKCIQPLLESYRRT